MFAGVGAFERVCQLERELEVTTTLLVEAQERERVARIRSAELEEQLQAFLEAPTQVALLDSWMRWLDLLDVLGVPSR